MYPYHSYMYMNFFPGNITVLVVILAVWTILWKGYALWIAAKNNHKGWFITLLILNTLGILEIIYVFKVANKKWAEVKNDFSRAFSSFR